MPATVTRSTRPAGRRAVATATARTKLALALAAPAHLNRHDAGRRFVLALVGSALIHLGAFAALGWFGVLVELPFQLTMPADVEIGISDAMDFSPPTTAGAVSGEAVEQAAHSSGEAPGGAGGLDGGVADAGLDGGVDGGVADSAVDAGVDGGLDAGAPDAGGAESLDAGAALAESATDAGAPAAAAERSDAGTPAQSQRIPPGALLAMRLDMNRVRASPLADSVERLLAALPDWRLLLSGSGINPVTDLDRLLIASPNLLRSRLVLAGRHVHGRGFVREAVAALAKAHAKPPPRWHRQDGVLVADWENEDVTHRVIAMLSGRRFIIARPVDLPRVLALAEARERRDRDGAKGRQADDAGGLLSMTEGAAFELEAENVPKFARGQLIYLPERVRADAAQDGPSHILVTVVATYESSAGAQAAAAYWGRVRDQYARSILLSLAGVGAPLREAKLSVDGDVFRIESRLRVQQARVIFSYVEGLFAGGAPRPPRPPTSAP